MKPRSLGIGLLWQGGAAIGFTVLVLAVSWFGRPDESDPLPPRTKEEIRAAENVREMSIDLNNPLRVQVEVDYSKGKKASWYPKGESPILAELVKEGKLPPVPERVGPEPCVVNGIEGTGRYGGTWYRLGNTMWDAMISWRLSGASLLRWSPQGYPLVPHIAKSYRASPDNREFIFELRKGMKWSDGHPFTADDIMYWYEYECRDTELFPSPPEFMKVRGKLGKVEKLGKYKVKFSFPEPHALFPERMASVAQRHPVEAPAHFKRKYHPRIGDRELIRKYMAAYKLPTPKAAYRYLSFGGGDYVSNPRYPRLWPWISRSDKTTSTPEFIRNPYYFMVDVQGNQLPYTDRILLQVKSPDMVVLAAANGEVTLQSRHMRYKDYTLLMSQREKHGYDVYHWIPGDGAEYSISVNLNRFVDRDKPESKLKAELLGDKRFRHALSLAIDRQAIIDAEYYGQGVSGNSGPPPGSYFYDPEIFKKYAEYHPDRANQLLDEIGLTRRDREGFRTFKDGTRMAFELNYCAYTGEGPGQFIVDDWAKVGVRVLLRERSQSLFFEEAWAYKHDFSATRGGGEFFPLLSPRNIVPVSGMSYFGLGYGRWYQYGGLYGRLPRDDLGIEPPIGHPVRKAFEIYDQITAEGDPVRRGELFHEVLEIAAENAWHIGICSPQPSLVIVKNGLRNVPRNGVYAWTFLSPSGCGMETYYLENPGDSPGAIAQIKRAILEPTLSEAAREAAPAPGKSTSGSKVATIIRYSFLAIGVLLAVLLGVKHPYIGRRLLIMVPTLLIISVVVFTVIQLPPGDFISTRIMALEQTGEHVDYQRIAEFKELFRLEEPMVVRYAYWMGLKWFGTFEEKDKGLLQGNLGRSMGNLKPVTELVGDRIVLTVLISLGTILFTWAIAIPIGIYSAVRQYSIGDYVFTVIGFIGMCIPGFLLALLLMYASAEWFGVPVTGLFSSRYGAQPEWTWGKVGDLLKHIWIPVLVLGVGGTGWMIRIMRGNLLDELRKPYVVTARAKGLRPIRLLLKYPVRVAVNPFVSGIGGLFPQLVSGGAIVAIVLSLPTVGPLMLQALMQEDMYLAGSMLMILSLLGVVGTLVSDLLLLWLDPRIRFGGGTR